MEKLNTESNIFLNYASKYFENGISIIPLRAGTKIPAIIGWQQFCTEPLFESTVISWLMDYPNCNIGIPLGSGSGIVALDFDYNFENLHSEIANLIKGSPVKKKGAKGFTAFYSYNGEPPKKWFKEGRAVVELLSTGNQTVAPPSIHPDTKKPYQWITPDTLLDIELEHLPALPPFLIDEIDSLFGYTKKVSTMVSGYDAGELDLNDVIKALSFIPSYDYATWITIGMALHHSCGDSGFSLWDDWSSKAPNYDSKVMPSKWYSFKTKPCHLGSDDKNLITIATLFHYAISNGYIPTFHGDDADFVDFREYNEIQGEAIGAIKESHFPDELLQAPGIVGKIAAWINATARKRQPILALGVAIAIAGTLFAHRVRSPSNLRTNFLILGLAESGSGKNHALDCAKALFEACGMSHLFFSKLASDTALLNALVETNGVGISLVDELGRELQVLTSKNSGGHESRLITMIMELFSCAHTRFKGKRFALNENNKDINQPCLNLYGTTTPARFFNALSNEEAIDGFLSRWLIFASDDIDPPFQGGGDIDTLPRSLVDEIRFIWDMPSQKEQETGMGAISLQPVPAPRIVQLSEMAQDIWGKFERDCNTRRVSEIKRGGKLASIWARAAEHAMKLALVAHPYRSGIIESVTMRWACDMALHLTTLAVDSIRENIADSDYEKNLNKVYTSIKEFNKRHSRAIKNWELAAYIKALRQKDRSEILGHLVESARIQQIETMSNGRMFYSYLAV